MQEEPKRPLSGHLKTLYYLALDEMARYLDTFNIVRPTSVFPKSFSELAVAFAPGQKFTKGEGVLKVFFEADAIAVLKAKAANPYWFWHIIQHACEEADSLPFNKEVLLRTVEKMGIVGKTNLMAMMAKDPNKLSEAEMEVAFPLAFVMVRLNEAGAVAERLFNPICHVVQKA